MGSHGLIDASNSQVDSSNTPIEPLAQKMSASTSASASNAPIEPVVLKMSAPAADESGNSAEPQPRPQPIRRRPKTVKQRREAVLEALQKNDNQIATAICKLADSVKILAEAQTASVNALTEAFATSSRDQQTQTMLLIELIRSERN